VQLGVCPEEFGGVRWSWVEQAIYRCQSFVSPVPAAVTRTPYYTICVRRTTYKTAGKYRQRERFFSFARSVSGRSGDVAARRRSCRPSPHIKDCAEVYLYAGGAMNIVITNAENYV